MSVDADSTLANWSIEKNYPGMYASDSGQVVGKLYGSATGPTETRNVFVIGPDGKIKYRVFRFNVLSAEAYADLEKAVDAAAGVPSP